MPNNYIESDLGNISINPRGSYSGSATYEYLDVVSFEGGSYLCNKTVTGVAPVSGQNTEHWYMLTLPGNLTPEYTNIYDEVKTMHADVKSDREASETAKNAAEAAQSVSENAALSATSSAEAAKESENAVSEMKTSVENTSASIITTANNYTDDAVKDKANRNELHSHDNKEVVDSISSADIDNWNAKSEFDGNYNSLSNKPNLGVYATKTELDGKSDKTHGHTELHSHSNADTLNGITPQKILSWDTKSEFSGNYADLSGKPTIPSTPEEVGADAVGSANSALSKAKSYADQKIADLIGSAPETLDTLKEIADAIGENEDAIDVLNQAIGTKADKTELHAHSNKDVLDGISSAKISEWNNKSDFSGNYNDLANKPASLPASDVHAWAKAEVKPTYTAAEVGALPSDTHIPSIEGLATAEHVNSKLNEKADKTELHSHSNKNVLDGITSEKIEEWNGKSDFSGSYNDLSDKPGREIIVSEVQPVNSEASLWINPIEQNIYEEMYNDLSVLKRSSISHTTKRLVADVINDTPHADTIVDYFAMKKNHNIYSTKVWLFSANPTTTCEKIGLNATLRYEPSTDTVEGVDDYLNGKHPLFNWFNCNYVRKSDGSPEVIATEFDDNYSVTGSVDVGCVQMPFYVDIDRSHESEGYHIISISDDRHILKTDCNFVPWSECVNSAGEILPYTVGSKYFSGVASDGLPRSQPNLPIQNFMSHNNIITIYGKKGEGYHGAGIERNTFQIVFALIKAAQKSSQKVFAGCTNYNFQYDASIQSEEMNTYFPVTNAQAANIIVGGVVSVGYAANNNGVLNKDRGQVSVRSYCDKVKVLRIETLDENNKAVYLDTDKPFNTMPVALTDSLQSPITLSSMPWHSGTTDCVIGKHDGSMVSNSNGRYPYRVQGREYAPGAYFVASDTVLIYETDHGAKDVYVCPKGTPRSTSDAIIKNTYDMIGRIPIVGESNSDWWIGDITFDLTHGATFPTGVGDSDVHGVGDRVYAGGAGTSGSRECLMGGNLWIGSDAGSSCWYCRSWLSGAFWNCAAAD